MVSDKKLSHTKDGWAYRLNPTLSGTWSITVRSCIVWALVVEVLILLYLELGLLPFQPTNTEVHIICLNPTLSGTWSITKSQDYEKLGHSVLILLYLELGLLPQIEFDGGFFVAVS